MPSKCCDCQVVATPVLVFFIDCNRTKEGRGGEGLAGGQGRRVWEGETEGGEGVCGGGREQGLPVG
eukprot:2571272-Rhodomonas_salina.1